MATYEYDAYGNLQASSGAEANNNPFRFSTKYFDSASGFYDYGFRFYDPVTGRWLNRDPIGEEGGINLYRAFGNNPVNSVDEYGLVLIELRWRKVIDSKIRGVYNHAYILIWETDSQKKRIGIPRYFGGYNTKRRSGGVQLKARSGFFIKGTPDYDYTLEGRMVLLYNNEPADKYLQICHTVAGVINALDMDYPLGGFGVNSNSVARTYAWAMGFPYPFRNPDYSDYNDNITYWDDVFKGPWLNEQQQKMKGRSKNTVTLQDR